MIKLEYTDIFNNKKIEKLQFSKNLIKHTYNEKSLFAILVDGKSMEPLISDKAVVVADLSNKTLENDGIYLVYYENKMWIKRYKAENKTFFSINPAFSHLTYKKEKTHLVAKVLLTFTNL
ncbi:MAG: S24 family peptidase [Arcobacter sp.]|uniref:S24 family peptidase n=1 Tax=Arcobacter sp. TaxID=1872629 RepID=UPI003AFFCEC8